MKEIKPIEEAAKTLKLAMDRYDDLDTAAKEARNKATDALNELNRAQKAFDEVITGLKAEQHRDSDWAREKFKPHRVEC